MAERRKLTKAERQAVYDKMEGHCAYCGCEISLQTMQVDHITPLRKGGQTPRIICGRPVGVATTISTR